MPTEKNDKVKCIPFFLNVDERVKNANETIKMALTMAKKKMGRSIRMIYV